MVIVFKLKQIRNRNGISLRMLSLKTGLTYSEIAQIERNEKDPRFSTIVKLSRALKVKIDDVFEIESEEQ